MAKIEHKEDHQLDRVDWLRPQERALLGGEIGVYDARFITLLNELKEEGEITSWERMPDHSQGDRWGIDYLVRIKGNYIPFQITGDKRDSQRRHRKHPHVPVIFFYDRGAIRKGNSPPAFHSPEHTKKRILEKAEDYLSKFK